MRATFRFSLVASWRATARSSGLLLVRATARIAGSASSRAVASNSGSDWVRATVRRSSSACVNRFTVLLRGGYKGRVQFNFKCKLIEPFPKKKRIQHIRI